MQLGKHAQDLHCYAFPMQARIAEPSSVSVDTVEAAAIAKRASGHAAIPLRCTPAVSADAKCSGTRLLSASFAEQY